MFLRNVGSYKEPFGAFIPQKAAFFRKFCSFVQEGPNFTRLYSASYKFVSFQTPQWWDD
jgi:hypothetical protein